MKAIKSLLSVISSKLHKNEEVLFGLIDEEEPKFAAFGCKSSYGGGGC